MAVRARRFRIAVRNCRGCRREWPAYLDTCRECAAALGEERLIHCARVVPPHTSAPVEPTLAMATAIELSRRHPPDASEWAARAWEAVVSLLANAVRVRSGPCGSIVATWPLESPEPVAPGGELALELRERVRRAGPECVELRGGVALGVIDGTEGSGAVERCAERLALAAAPGQWLFSVEAARRLENRFEFRPAGVVPRWQMRIPEGHRALAARLEPPLLPSAVFGDVPQFVVGRAGERRRLLAEMATAAAGRRRVVLVSAPAGGGKSYLLRQVLAQAELTLAAGIAFPPLGSRPLEPLRALLTALGAAGDSSPEEGVGDALAQAASRRARVEPAAIVVDDVHWASREDIAALASAIAGSENDAPLAWILSTRTAALPAVEALVEVSDTRVELPPLRPADRVRVLAHRLGAVPDGLRSHASVGGERGNPLFLEHLAEAVNEGSVRDGLPGSLHEAVLTRLDGLSQRARRLTQWSSLSSNPARDLGELEREVGDWLDRLETSDIADLATVSRYLARLRAVDLDLVVARSVLGMPVSANRRLAWAIERLAAASTAALLDYCETVAREGREAQAAHEARTAAERAERTLRLADAERLLTFASRHDADPELARKRGDLALALGRPHDALVAYRAAADLHGDRAELQRRMARAEALLGDVDPAIARIETLVQDRALEPPVRQRALLDLARLRGIPPPDSGGAYSAVAVAGTARTRAWAQVGDRAVARDAMRALVLVGEPAACAAEVIENAALSHFAGLTVGGLDAAASAAIKMLDNPRAVILFNTTGAAEARRTFLHWCV